MLSLSRSYWMAVPAAALMTVSVMWFSGSRPLIAPSFAFTAAGPQVVVKQADEFKLTGLVVPQEGSAIALIQDLQAGASGLYQVGDPLPNGASVVDISGNQATVRFQDGRMVALRIETESP